MLALMYCQPEMRDLSTKDTFIMGEVAFCAVQKERAQPLLEVFSPKVTFRALKLFNLEHSPDLSGSRRAFQASYFR